MNRKSKWIFIVIAATAVIAAAGGFAWSSLGYSGFGMMGGSGFGMMGYSSSNSISSLPRIPEEEVTKIIDKYLVNYFDSSFYIEEIMAFSNNYYAQIGHQDNETLAFELIIDPYTGEIGDEPGPNMMWNRSYGNMRWRFWRTDRKMTVSESEAIESAQKYLDRYWPGISAEPDADRFNGYYTIHTVNNKGEITGMLSVNGFNSRVWFHNWHGISVEG